MGCRATKIPGPGVSTLAGEGIWFGLVERRIEPGFSLYRPLDANVERVARPIARSCRHLHALASTALPC
jgi:hypothetical protein